MLTLQIVPYSEIHHLSSLGRIKKLLKLAKENKIVLLEGRLKEEEEAELIKTTMEEIDNEFKGIELAVLKDLGKKKEGYFDSVRRNLASILLGGREGLTILGPATIVKEIKKDPNKIQLLMSENVNKRKKRKQSRGR